MKIKDGVKIQGLHIGMQPVLKNAGSIWEALGEELVITCGMNGMHSAGSLHYYGRAVDLRTWYFSDKDKLEAQRLLQLALGEDYDVVLEDTHMHCEYDPPKVSELEIKYRKLAGAAQALCYWDWEEDEVDARRAFDNLFDILKINEGK